MLDEKVDPFLVTQEAPRDSQAERPRSADRPETILERGAVVGRYVIVDCLGVGGMGVVYGAYDPLLDRKVALKLLRTDRGEGSTQEGRTRLLREAQAMARLSHPNVLAVHEVGTIDSQIFIAMEFVDGGTLRGFLEERERPLHEVLGIFLQAGRGLQAAHAVGLVHRDFKPDNVLLGKNGRVYVADFGLVCQVLEPVPRSLPPLSSSSVESAALSATLTQTGTIMGTPAYMSPEQGQGLATDEKSDQYSYCVALYEAVCRQHPFAGRDGLAILSNAMLGKLREPPREAQVPGRLLRILRRGLSARPEDRHPSMAALLAELSWEPRRVTLRVLFAVLVLALLGWSGSAYFGYLGYKPPKKRACELIEEKFRGMWTEESKRTLWTAFSATGKPYAAASAREVERVLTEYTSAWTSTHKEACQTAQVRRKQTHEILSGQLDCLGQSLQETQSLLALFAKADGVVVEKSVPAVHALINVKRCTEQEALAPPLPPIDPAVRQKVDELRAELAEAKAGRDAGKYETALPIAARVRTAGQKLHYRPVEAEALLLLGELQARVGQPVEAEETLYQATFAADAGRHHSVGALAAAHLVQVLGFQRNNFPLAHHFARQAAARIEGLGGSDELSAILAHHHALVYNAQGQYDAALGLSLQAVELRRRLVGSADFTLIAPLSTTGQILLNLGRHEEALLRLREALQIGKKSLGDSHTLVASTLFTIAGVDLFLARFDEARQQFQQALAINQAALGPSHPDVGHMLFGLSSTELRQGHYAEGLQYADRAAEILKDALGQQSVRFAAALSNCGYALNRLGRYDQGLLRGEQALALLDKQQVNSRLLHRGYALLVLGEAQLGLKRLQLALEPLESAVALFGSSGADKDALGLAQRLLASALYTRDKENDRERARALALSARSNLSPRFDPTLRAELDRLVLQVGK